jgi:hypothetical protein
MNEDRVNTNKNTIDIDQTSSEQQHFHDKQQDERSIKSKEVGSRIKKAKKIPMTPTRLYVFFSFLHDHLDI